VHQRAQADQASSELSLTEHKRAGRHSIKSIVKDQAILMAGICSLDEDISTSGSSPGGGSAEDAQPDATDTDVAKGEVF